MKVLVEISAGELFDKITILKIKTEKIIDKSNTFKTTKIKSLARLLFKYFIIYLFLTTSR